MAQRLQLVDALGVSALLSHVYAHIHRSGHRFLAALHHHLAAHNQMVKVMWKNRKRP